MAESSHDNALAWCGWSEQEATTKIFASDVMCLLSHLSHPIMLDGSMRQLLRTQNHFTHHKLAKLSVEAASLSPSTSPKHPKSNDSTYCAPDLPCLVMGKELVTNRNGGLHGLPVYTLSKRF
jgi:hypothetical protein